jgi:hypothetical protein
MMQTLMIAAKQLKHFSRRLKIADHLGSGYFFPSARSINIAFEVFDIENHLSGLIQESKYITDMIELKVFE